MRIFLHALLVVIGLLAAGPRLAAKLEDCALILEDFEGELTVRLSVPDNCAVGLRAAVLPEAAE